MTKPRVDRIVDLGIVPNNVGTAAGTVWFTGDSTVIRLDPRNNQIVARIAVYGASAAASGEAGIWIISQINATASRIDPQTNKVIATVQLPNSPLGVAIENSTVWVITQGGRLVRIGSHTNHVVAEIPFQERLPQGSPRIMFDLIRISAGEDAVWVLGLSTLTGKAAVWRVNPRTNAITATTPVSFRPWGMAVGEGGVWVASSPDHSWCQGTVSRIDPRTNRVIAKITVGYSPQHVAVGGGSVWVANLDDGTISQIDPRTNQVVARIVADAGWGLAFSEQGLWAREFDFHVFHVREIRP